MSIISQPHIIFSVENPMHEPKVHAPNHEEAIKWLRSQGEDARDAMGYYGQPERSIIVVNPKNKAGLEQLAQDIGQDSIITSDGHKHKLKYLNGERRGHMVLGEGTKIFSEMPPDMFTAFKDENGDHVIFQHQFDHSTLRKAEGDQPPAVKINPNHGKMIADAYQQMQHEPNHPEVKEAYNALIKETGNQFKDIMNSGLKLSRIEPGQENPYKNSKEMHHDIENNNHLWYYPTEQGFGTEGQNTPDHPMLQQTQFTHGGQPLLANDVFRIVHDINGHYKGGKSGFGPTGEHQAFLTHKKMFSPLAAKALATETMGQNNWVNFGPYGEENRKNPANTRYADQKAGLLPDEIINGNWHAS